MSHYILYIYIYCFHVLGVINNAAVNIGVHVSFQIRAFVFSSDNFLGVDHLKQVTSVLHALAQAVPLPRLSFNLYPI